MEWVLHNWQSVLLILAAQVAGLIALIGLLDQGIKQKRKETNEQEDRLIKLYKDEIDQLKKNQEQSEQELKDLRIQYETEFKELNEKIVKVNGENEIMKALLEGRDKTSLEFQKQGFAAIKRSERMEKLTTSGFTTMNSNIERLAKAIEKHLTTEVETTTGSKKTTITIDK